MNLWKVELHYMFRSWRGWTLAGTFMLASIFAIITGLLIDRNTDSPIQYSRILELYGLFLVPVYMLFIGLFVAALSFDANKDLSMFLRLRFRVHKILITKVVTWLLISEALFFLTYAQTFVVASILFDSESLSTRAV